MHARTFFMKARNLVCVCSSIDICFDCTKQVCALARHLSSIFAKNIVTYVGSLLKLHYRAFEPLKKSAILGNNSQTLLMTIIIIWLMTWPGNKWRFVLIAPRINVSLEFLSMSNLTISTIIRCLCKLIKDQQNGTNK